MVEEFAEGATAGRIILNQPSTHGAIGGIYNSLDTSFTLSCGTGGGNITMDNISISHLLEYQKIARLRHNYRWMNLPDGVIDSPSLGSTAILSIYGRNF
jgi:acetaldehyde dehydrogenase/alcohol dehydrogenase